MLFHDKQNKSDKFVYICIYVYVTQHEKIGLMYT